MIYAEETLNVASVIDIVRARAPGIVPMLGLVLGSGLGELADEVEDAVRIAYADLPGLPIPSASGHAGDLVIGRLAGVDAAVFAGRGHYYEHGNPREMAVAVRSLAALGARVLVLTNAAGSLRPEVGPGKPMLITDHIAYNGLNPMIGTPGDKRFVNLVDAYDPALRDLARAAAVDSGVALAEGVYMWFSGPAFETPAEIRMARIIGADAVGMSTVPEVIMARAEGLRVAAISMITNLGAGMTGRGLSHEETKAEAAKGSADFKSLIRAFVARIGAAG
ncbi:MAG: purine-nucleoside phosphorylase [Ancalomicrobiaceae bacterium]|nr:purine-nucleoside phosphorylase [Ancalomicrobiaceae bacterium]